VQKPRAFSSNNQLLSAAADDAAEDELLLELLGGMDELALDLLLEEGALLVLLIEEAEVVAVQRLPVTRGAVAVPLAWNPNAVDAPGARLAFQLAPVAL